MKYYFLKSQIKDGHEKLSPLPYQIDESGEEIKTGLNCTGDKEIRRSYSIGTIYGTDRLTLSKGYYTSGGIYPLDIPMGDYKSEFHKPPKTMVDAWNTFKKENPEILRKGDFSDLSDIFHSAELEKETERKEKETSFLASVMADPKYACPTIEDDGFYISKENWFFIISCILKKQPLLITGPTGTGKTEIIRMACAKTGIPFRKYDMGGIHDPVEQLNGTHRLVEGSSVYDYSRFAQDVQQEGVILLDEISRAPSEINNLLFPCLDDSRCLNIENAGSKDLRELPLHPDCTFIATANIGDEYRGVNQLDMALVNRFLPLEMTFIPEDVEVRVLTQREKIKNADARKVVQIANKIRNLTAERELVGEQSVSIRESLQAARLVSWGYSVLQALERTFLPKFEGTDKEGDKAVVKALLATL